MDINPTWLREPKETRLLSWIVPYATCCVFVLIWVQSLFGGSSSLLFFCSCTCFLACWPFSVCVCSVVCISVRVVNEEHVQSYTMALPRANRVATVTDSPAAISKCDKIRSVFGCICF